MAITIALIIIGMLFPIMMILFGRWLSKHAPQDINYIVGYRTKRSMASKEAWDFANSTAGRYWITLGKYCLPISILLCALMSAFIHVVGIDERFHAFFIYGITVLTFIPFLSVVPYTEKKLKERFK